MTYTCIQNKSQLHGTGNISSDPDFQQGAQGDYRLDSDSPCRDAGLTAALPADVADLDGDSDTDERIPRDLPLYARVDDTVVDMGAYEYQAAMVDCNGNGIVDSVDIQNETSRDCNDNGRPDECDIACGGGHECNEVSGSYDLNHDGIPDDRQKVPTYHWAGAVANPDVSDWGAGGKGIAVNAAGDVV